MLYCFYCPASNTWPKSRPSWLHQRWPWSSSQCVWLPSWHHHSFQISEPWTGATHQSRRASTFLPPWVLGFGSFEKWSPRCHEIASNFLTSMQRSGSRSKTGSFVEPTSWLVSVTHCAQANHAASAASSINPSKYSSSSHPISRPEQGTSELLCIA